MAELSPGQIQEISTIVDRVVERRLSGGNPQSPRRDNPDSPVNSVRWDAGVNNMLNSFGKMTLGMYDTTDAVADFKKIVTAFGPDSPFKNVVGGIIDTVGNVGVAMNRSMMDSAKSGFTFAQNLGLYDVMVLSARMNLKEWNNLIRESGTQIAGLATDANKAGLLFLSAAKQLQEDPDARRAIIAGTATVEEFNTALRMVSQGAKFNNLSEAQARQNMAESARGLVFELDMMAKLTGKSRERMAKDIEEQNATAQMRLRIASMTVEERDAYLKNQAIISQLPKQAQELLTAYMTGGLRNTRDRENAAAFTGTNIESIVRQVAAIRGTSPESDDQRRILTARLQEELAAVGANKKLLEQMSVLAGTDNAMAQKMGAVFADLADASASASKRQQEAFERGETMSQYITKLYEESLARIKRVGEKPVTDEEKAAAASRALQALETKVRDLQVGAAVNFTDKLNNVAGDLITNFGGLKTATEPFTTEMFQNMGSKLESFYRSLGGTGETITPQDRTNPMRQRREQALTPVTPVFETQPRAPTGENPVPDRFTGSKVATGDWFENFGAGKLMKLHGSEAVVPQEKIGEFVKDMVARTPSLIADLQGNLKSTLSEAKASMPTADTFKDMFSNIKLPETTASTAQSGVVSSSTFASSTQNTDIMTELVKGMNQLNIRVERLITAVEEGADKNARATKSKGNVLA